MTHYNVSRSGGVMSSGRTHAVDGDTLWGYVHSRGTPDGVGGIVPGEVPGWPPAVIVVDRREVTGMAWQGLVGKAVPTLVTGVVGAAAYEALAKAPWRRMTVSAAAVGLRGARATERVTREAAERARLATADVLAEAAERVGERVPAPADSSSAAGHGGDDACH